MLEQAIRSFHPQILHTHFGHLGWVNAGLAKKYGLKHVVSFYGADVHHVPYAEPQWLPRYREMGSIVDRVLCEGPYMARSIEGTGIPGSKIRVHRLGVDLTKIHFQPRRLKEGAPLRFLIVGTFREKKGIPIALRALGLFQRLRPDIEITIIGDADESKREQAEKRAILNEINAWNLRAKVRMLGVQPHDVVLNEAYDHHIFLSPSVVAVDRDCEGGAPVSIIEMAASGMPVVSTTHCDIPYVLSPRNADYLVRERDSEALCGALAQLMADDWHELVTKNRCFIEAELDTRTQGDRLYEIYTGLLDDREGSTLTMATPSITSILS
jgi:colanic acid/amylovoran biosynthesis glycosyltransferase